jgi:hypothetical protein
MLEWLTLIVPLDYLSFLQLESQVRLAAIRGLCTEESVAEKE